MNSQLVVVLISAGWFSVGCAAGWLARAMRQAVVERDEPLNPTGPLGSDKEDSVKSESPPGSGAPGKDSRGAPR